MSGLYLLGVLVLWIGLTWLLLRLGLRVMARVQLNRGWRIPLVGAVAAVWIGTSLWYAGGRTIYYDKQVERLCALDGGIEVYETVGLPADMFNQRGQIDFFKPDQGEEALGGDYVYKSETAYLDTSESKQIRILRHHDLVYRRSDSKLLGEQIQYARKGGAFPDHGINHHLHAPNSREIAYLGEYL